MHRWAVYRIICPHTLLESETNRRELAPETRRRSTYRDAPSPRRTCARYALVCAIAPFPLVAGRGEAEESRSRINARWSTKRRILVRLDLKFSQVQLQGGCGTCRQTLKRASTASTERLPAQRSSLAFCRRPRRSRRRPRRPRRSRSRLRRPRRSRSRPRRRLLRLHGSRCSSSSFLRAICGMRHLVSGPARVGERPAL